MSRAMRHDRFDVAVIGGGAAGIGAAIAAARNGARTVLIDAGPMVGGELVSGIPVDGCLSSRGEWVVGGVVAELFAECERLGGYIGPINDFRSLYVVAIDPEIMKIAVVNLLHAAGVTLSLYAFADDVVMEDGQIAGLVTIARGRRTLIEASVFIDASGDGDVCVAAGAAYEKGDPATADLQPLTLMFRMVGVDAERLLRFVRDHPENAGLGEYEGLGLSPTECAQALYDQGLPKVFLIADGPLMRQAIASGELHASSMIGITPTSLARKEVSLNTTRLGQVDATDTGALSGAFPELLGQVWRAASFARRRIPGFEDAVFSGAAPRVGIRETRRIVGEYRLSDEDVAEGIKHADGIAKGAHEIDVHLSGVGHVRRAIREGGSYDIPYHTIIPKGLRNAFAIGRCLSSSRIAHSSARVMGTCLALGQAAGTAAALASRETNRPGDVRLVNVAALRRTLRDQGVVLDGTS